MGGSPQIAAIDAALERRHAFPVDETRPAAAFSTLIRRTIPSKADIGVARVVTGLIAIQPVRALMTTTANVLTRGGMRRRCGVALLVWPAKLPAVAIVGRSSRKESSLVRERRRNVADQAIFSDGRRI